jgi:hypothetical protein
MTTLDRYYQAPLKLEVCKEHTPFISAISDVADTQYTFCEMCENNIERYYYDGDPERLPEWSDWYVTK